MQYYQEGTFIEQEIIWSQLSLLAQKLALGPTFTVAISLHRSCKNALKARTHTYPPLLVRTEQASAQGQFCDKSWSYFLIFPLHQQQAKRSTKTIFGHS